jgi:hypothetical protein
MDSILAVDLGTYCDNKLMEYALTHLQHEYKIVYVTDERHKVPKASDIVVEHYRTPTFFVNEPNLKASNSSYNFNMWMLMNPLKAREAFVWRSKMREMLHKLIAEHDPVALVVLYPAAGILWMLESDVANRVPTFILYNAPGLLNASIPWLFDSAMQDESVSLFKDDAKNLASGEEYINRISSMSTRSESVMDVYFKVHHVMCWHKSLMPKLATDRRMSTIYAGTLLPPNMANAKADVKKSIPRAIRSELQRPDASIIFVSFGSYVNSALLQRITPMLMGFLESYCESHAGYRVVFHNGTHANASKHVVCVKGYVPYEIIVPRSKLVVFTGSACLQNICMYHGVPMLFVPQLNEQFFWARLYKRNAGVEYVNIRRSVADVQEQLQRRIELSAVMTSGAAFRKKLAAGLQKDHEGASTNAARKLVRIVKKLSSKMRKTTT